MRDEKSNIREELEDKIQEIQQQMEPAAEVVKVKPRQGEGVQGSRKIVKENGKVYIYHKVDGEWYKSEMEKG